jgi:hypothetical protein
VTEADRKPFGLMISAMAAAYRKSGDVDEACLAGYWLLLADLELSAISAAATAAARASKFMPTAAEIRELVVEQIEYDQRKRLQEEKRWKYTMSLSVMVARECVALGKDDDWLRRELDRVGENTNLVLPWPGSFIEEERERLAKQDKEQGGG